MSWKNKKVLVTGAGGFIGSHLAERLVKEGADVRAFVRYNSGGSWGWLDHSVLKKQMHITSGDVRDREGVHEAMKGVHTVFHLAALVGIPYSYASPASYVRTNVEGTLNVMQCALEAGVKKVVHTSTSEVYGTARTPKIKETHVLRGQSPYSASKIAADKIAEAFHLSFGLPVATVRPFNTYGPRQSARAVIPTIMTQVLTRSKVELGYLDSLRDFNYVADTVEGFILAALKSGAVGEVINIGSGRTISIGDLAKMIFKISGKKIKVVENKTRLRPVMSEVRRLCADNTHAKKILGWEPRTRLEKGLEETFFWVEGNLKYYRSGYYAV